MYTYGSESILFYFVAMQNVFSSAVDKEEMQLRIIKARIRMLLLLVLVIANARLIALRLRQ